MLYFTPALARCSPETWWQHFRDPANAHLSLAVLLGAEVVTSWVGLAGEWEDPPRLFLVRLRRRAKGRDGWKDVEHWWHTTREGALTQHQDLVDGLLSPTGR